MDLSAQAPRPTCPFFELAEGNFEFVDNYKTNRTGRQKLIARAVIAGGKRFVA